MKITQKTAVNQVALSAEVIPLDNGSFKIVPRKPILEVGPAEAARILGVATSSLPNILDRPLAQKIRWRWTSDAKGKRLYDSASLYEYLKATRDSELAKGDRKGKRI